MLDEKLASAMLDALRPPLIVSPQQFAEGNIRLSAAMAARPGPLSLAPYQIEPLNHFADDDADTVTLEWAAQCGKSTIVNALVGYVIACAPGPAMHVSPTEARSKEYVRERLDAMIAASPTLRALVGAGDSRKGSSGAADNVTLKQFPGGLLAFASSHMGDSLRARAIRWLLLDEVDGFAASIKNEGDPVALALKRTETFEDNGRRVLLVSTPTTRTGSRIHSWYLRGDQRQWHVKCDCGAEGPIEFHDIKWTPKKPETAHHVCPECGSVHDETARIALINKGKWVATAQGVRGHRSYHLTELSSVFSSMASVVGKFEAATTPELRQTFYNTSLAQAYDAASEVEVSASALQQRVEPIAPPYRADIRFVSAGVDVQDNRVEYTFLAHHDDGSMSVLNHVPIWGDTSSPVIWQSLDDAMASTFLLTDGRELPVLVQAVDTGRNIDRVIEYVQGQRRKSRSCYAIKGVGKFDTRIIRQGSSTRGNMPLWLVGVDTVKLIVMKSLASGDEDEPGYIRVPEHLDEEYFASLASEELITRSVRNVLKYEWKPNRRRNEALDCLVYAYAIARHPKLTVPAVNAKPTLKTEPQRPSFEELAKRMAALSNQ